LDSFKQLVSVGTDSGDVKNELPERIKLFIVAVAFSSENITTENAETLHFVESKITRPDFLSDK
jgi:hypothetical protein